MRHVKLYLVFVSAIAAGISSLAVHGQTPARKKLLFLTSAALYKHSSLAPA